MEVDTIDKPPIRKRKNKREAILTAAIDVLCIYGCDGSTLDKIAREAGVSKALVVKYYGSQRELIRCCLKSIVDEVVQKLEENLLLARNTYAQHIEYSFEVFRAMRPKMRMLLSVYLTPANENLALEAMPEYYGIIQSHLFSFPETSGHSDKAAISYTVYGLLMNYLIGGDEQNYRRAASAVFRRFGLDKEMPEV